MLCLSYQGVHLSIEYFSCGSSEPNYVDKTFRRKCLPPLYNSQTNGFDAQKISLIIFLEIHIRILTRMTTFIKTKFKISEDQMNNDKYRLAANITVYHVGQTVNWRKYNIGF